MTMKKVGLKSGQARPKPVVSIGALHKASIDRVAKPPVSHPSFPRAFVPGATTMSDGKKGI